MVTPRNCKTWSARCLSLLSFAVSLEYADSGEDGCSPALLYNNAAGKLMQQQQQQQQQQQAAAKGQAPFPDLHAPEVQQQLARVFQLLHVNTSKGSPADHLQAAVEVLRDSVLPSLTDASAQQSRPQEFPLGFETGDPAVDSLAMLLRILYVKDLRGLQSAIEGSWCRCRCAPQPSSSYTANPRTDASLGKVGH
ncbi:putative carnitine deficiency-associated protein-domain-containing protein [Scenedesmus sp. NREL 46B-D3]|nr:putative carnitine deficiency-associated protein-domain-containing protein [Scenedesmus sp. NREL 46B-D3]